jgi:hypothetical protein
VPGHSPSSPWARHGPALRAAPLGGGAVRQSFARPRMYGSAAALVGINGHALMPTVSAGCRLLDVTRARATLQPALSGGERWPFIAC